MQAIITDESLAVLALWYVVNTSLSAYYKLIDAFGSPKASLFASTNDWQMLGIHKSHIQRLTDIKSIDVFLKDTAQKTCANLFNIVYHFDKNYPKQLNELFDPPPLLFYKGDIKVLSLPQIAIVGTRKPSDYAKKTTFDLASYIAQSNFVVTSGLADGVDSFAHTGAMTCGKTAGVMGTGIDVVYPKSHGGLFADIVNQGGCLVSELLPATPASKHTFPRRNRLVVGLSCATVVTEATMQSGSLISARLTAEQGKQVFVIPGQIDNPNSEGCHHLIREGATLVYHPTQILEDINHYDAPPTHFSNPPSIYHNNSKANPAITPTPPKNTPKVNLPVHLTTVFDVLDNTPKDLDILIDITKLSTADLLAKLVELEILGVITNSSGRYVRL